MSKSELSTEEFLDKYDMGSARNLKLLDDLFENTNTESDRGTLIIASSIMEEYLTECIQEILPFDSNSKISKLFKYPGLLSSFSSKIEMSYCFGLFDENINSSLNFLRKMRNDCAHSIESFDFGNNVHKLTEMNNLGTGITKGIKHFALMMQARFKVDEIKVMFNKQGVSQDEQRKLLEEVVKDNSLIEAVKKPALKLEFITGLLELQAIMEVQKDIFLKNRL